MKTQCFYAFFLFNVFLQGFCGCKSEDLLFNPHRGLKERRGLFSSIQGCVIISVFKTLDVTDKLDCIFACLIESSCLSTNFAITGDLKHLCELSNETIRSRPQNRQLRPGYIHMAPDLNCRETACKNGATCEPACNEQGYRCKCGVFNKGDYCELWTVGVSSCKDIFEKTTYRTDMAYTYMIDNKQTDIYCHLSSHLCGSKGWTQAMKIDGSKKTFIYSSALWSDKNTYGLSVGKTGFDNHETKMPSYWGMPFQSLCVGLKVDNNLNWAAIPYAASSLYDVIADGSYRPFTIGRNKWLSLIGESSFQLNCNAEGFNGGIYTTGLAYSRIGIRGNEQNHCRSPDSVLGFGLPWNNLTCGNRCKHGCNNGEIEITAFGYILIK